MIRVLHVITGLGQGGAETALWRLLSQTDPARFTSNVVSLTSEDALVPRISALGVPVHHLRLQSLRGGFTDLAKLWRIVRQLRPDVLQGWMSHGNLMALMARIAVRARPAVVWGIRQSLYDLSYEKLVTAGFIRLNAKLSGWPAAIVYNSHTSRRQHEALGFSSSKSTVIANGFDVSMFAPSDEARSNLRRELKLPNGARLVGIVGRFHPVKDHQNFIRAAKRVWQRHPECRFVMVGAGLTWDNRELVHRLQEVGLAEGTYLLGSREDMPRIYAALDIAVSSSYTEAFPNAIGEAMSSGVPCVATDVGDSGLLVGNTGIVTPPRDPEALASGINRLLDLAEHERRVLGLAARARVAAEFSLEKMVASFSSLYLSLENDRSSAGSLTAGLD